MLSTRTSAGKRGGIVEQNPVPLRFGKVTDKASGGWAAGLVPLVHQTPYSTDVSYSAVRPPANCTPPSWGV